MVLFFFFRVLSQKIQYEHYRNMNETNEEWLRRMAKRPKDTTLKIDKRRLDPNDMYTWDILHFEKKQAELFSR
jgi:hypothetical protein